MNEFKFKFKYEPKIEINPNLPENVTIDGQVKCPKCGWAIINKIGFMVAGGDSRSKYRCGVCGYIFESH